MAQTSYNSKKLHIHSTPLIAFGMVTTLAVLVFGVHSDSARHIRPAFQPLVTVAPKTNGLASVRLNKPATSTERLHAAMEEAMKARTSKAPQSVMPGVADLGNSIALQSAVQN